jgi:putative PIN family toxin of toxin-antitoxin system
VSAFATRGLCVDVFRHVLAEHTLVGGEVVLRELRRVLRRKLKLPSRMVNSIEALLREHEVTPKPKAPADIPIRDLDDKWVVASAVAAQAEILVTGDRELIDLGQRAPLRILDPRGFWNLIREESDETR